MRTRKERTIIWQLGRWLTGSENNHSNRHIRLLHFPPTVPMLWNFVTRCSVRPRPTKAPLSFEKYSALLIVGSADFQLGLAGFLRQLGCSRCARASARW